MKHSWLDELLLLTVVGSVVLLLAPLSWSSTSTHFTFFFFFLYPPPPHTGFPLVGSFDQSLSSSVQLVTLLADSVSHWQMWTNWTTLLHFKGLIWNPSVFFMALFHCSWVWGGSSKNFFSQDFAGCSPAAKSGRRPPRSRRHQQSHFIVN